MLDYEKKYYNDKIKYIAGTDEAGRGPLVGPVVASAVIFPKNYSNKDINDSKKLSESKRIKLANIIKKDAISYATVFVDAKEIDRINILEASRQAMEKALRLLKHRYDLVITDAMVLKNEKCEVIPLIKADAKVLAVAAASILSKVARDEYMYALAKKYPEYHFEKHKGYPTKEHLAILKKYGPIKGLYRYSYKPVKELEHIQLSLFE